MAAAHRACLGLLLAAAGCGSRSALEIGGHCLERRDRAGCTDGSDGDDDGTDGDGDGDMVWTGERFISVWEEEDQLRVAVLHADGSEERRVEVDGLERPAAITLGAFPGRVGILVSRYRAEPEQRDQWFIQLDALGEVVTPARPIEVEYTTWQRLVGTEEGWLHIRPQSFGEPALRQVLGLDGEPSSEATPFADGRRLQESGLQDTFIPRPGQGEMIAAWQNPDGGDMHVEFLDGRGEVLRGWSGPSPADAGLDDGYFVEPHVAFVGERVLVTWHGLAPDAQPNRVVVREFGCVP